MQERTRRNTRHYDILHIISSDQTWLPISFLLVTLFLSTIGQSSYANFDNGTPYPYTERYSQWSSQRAFSVGAYHDGTGMLTPKMEFRRYKQANFTQYIGLSPHRHAPVYQHVENKGLDWQADHKDWADLATFQEQTDIAMAIGNGPTAMQIYDEPGDSSIPTIVERINWARTTYQENLADTGRPEPLLYANLSIRKIDVDNYIQQVKPDLISWTEYPLFLDGSTDSDYFSRMAIARKASLQHNLPMWNFQQAFSRYAAANNYLYRLPSRTDTRFQAFSFLGHGGQGLKYFMYRSEMFPEPILDPITGAPTEVYYHIQDVIPELKNLGRALPALRPVGQVGFLGNALTKYDDVREFTGRGSLQAVDTSRPAQVSFFEDVNGDEYFMIVNLAHRADNDFVGENMIRLRFPANIAQIERLNRFTGQVDLLNTKSGVGERYLDLILLGGNGDLFKYKTANDFSLINHAPTADAGGPYFFSAQSKSVLLNGSGSFDPDQEIEKHKWLLPDGSSEVSKTLQLRLADSGLTNSDSTSEITLEVNDVAGKSMDTVSILYFNSTPSINNVSQDVSINSTGLPEYQFTVDISDLDTGSNTEIPGFEELLWEVDREPATSADQVGDGITVNNHTASTDTVSLATLTNYFGSSGLYNAFVNVRDRGGLIDTKAIQIIAAIPGDANLDNRIDSADLGILGANYNLRNRNWAQADFNNDGLVDVADLGILSANWSSLSLSDAALVNGTLPQTIPEPTSFILLAALIATLSPRHRYHGRKSCAYIFA